MLKKISERNRRFAKADRMAQRVMIARDVISQIDAGELVPTNGTYVTPTYGATDGVGPCRVCALGALAVSVMDGDALHGMARDMRYGLGPYFDEAELDLIEHLFEGWVLEPEGRGTALRCSLWRPGRNDARDRLRALMQGIIAGKGALSLSRVAPNLRWSRKDRVEE